MLRKPHTDLAALIGSAPISGASHRAGDLLPADLPAPGHAIAFALSAGLAFAVILYAVLSALSAPLPAPTGGKHYAHRIAPHVPAHTFTAYIP